MPTLSIYSASIDHHQMHFCTAFATSSPRMKEKTRKKPLRKKVNFAAKDQRHIFHALKNVPPDRLANETAGDDNNVVSLHCCCSFVVQ